MKKTSKKSFYTLHEFPNKFTCCIHFQNTSNAAFLYRCHTFYKKISRFFLGNQHSLAHVLNYNANPFTEISSGRFLTEQPRYRFWEVLGPARFVCMFSSVRGCMARIKCLHPESDAGFWRCSESPGNLLAPCCLGVCLFSFLKPAALLFIN